MRDYEPGDSYNRIHWKSVARTGRLVVKEFELDPTADLWLIVDMDRNVHIRAPWHPVERDEVPAVLWKESRHGIALAPSTEEYVVSAAASLARHFILRNRSVGLVAHSRHREVIQADRGERQLTKILETLAVIEPLGNIPFSQVLTGEGQSLSRHTTLIVISSSPDPTWVAALRDLQRRGVYSVAVVVDAASFGPSVPSTPVLADTDAVFDGTSIAFYKEEDEPNPLNLYSKTNLEGARAVFAEDPNAIITRVNFYGWSLTGRRSLAEFFFHNLTHNKSAVLPTSSFAPCSSTTQPGYLFACSSAA